MFFNLAGFWLAPNISGYVMDQYPNPKEGLIMGYRLMLGWNFFTLLFLFSATCFSYREYRQKYGKLSAKAAEELDRDEKIELSNI